MVRRQNRILKIVNNNSFECIDLFQVILMLIGFRVFENSVFELKDVQLLCFDQGWVVNFVFDFNS